MRCKNCGNELKSTEKFCTLCGNYVDDEDLPSNSLEDDRLGKMTKKQMKHEKVFDQEPVPEEEPVEEKKKDKKKKEQKIEIPDDIAIEEEDNRITDPNMAAFIGEDYKWVAERPFNIYALLLSWIYFLYRKLYLIGIIGLIVTGIILVWIPAIIVPYVILSMVFSGMFFNRIYLLFVERKVTKIEQTESDSGEFGVEERCKKKGGVNVWMALLIFLVFLVIVLSQFVHIQYNGKISKYWGETSSNQANCKTFGKRISTSFTDYGISGELQELVCEITTTPKKTYNIYVRIIQDGKTEYMYFKPDDDGYFRVEADTTKIPELETLQKDYGLTQYYQDMLTMSKELASKFDSMKEESEYEDKLMEKGKDKQAKTHFVFTKDDIFG